MDVCVYGTYCAVGSDIQAYWYAHHAEPHLNFLYAKRFLLP